MTISAGDIAAALDVVTQLAEEADSLAPADAIALRDQVAALQKGAKFCHEMLTTSAVNALEKQPIQVGDSIWAAEDDGKWRLNHSALRKIVERDALQWGLNPTTGEINANIAVTRAIEQMNKLFVSPSSFPKQEALAGLGLSNKDIGTWERVNKKLKEHKVKVVDDE